MSEPEMVRIGAHEVGIEGPDAAVYRLRGPVTAGEIRALVDVERPLWQGRARVYVFIHTHAITVGAGIVLLGRDVFRAAPERVVAVVGASFSIRVTTEMLVRSLRLLGKTMLVRNFADEQSARAWLQAQRDRPSDAGRKSRPSAG